MNKILIILCVSYLSIGLHAQSFNEKYLQDATKELSRSSSAKDMDVLLNTFSKTKSNDWVGFYYRAVALYQKNELIGSKTSKENKNEINALANKNAMGIYAEQNKNPELQILLGLIWTQKMVLNPAAFSEKDKNKIVDIITHLEKDLPNNPRLALLKIKFAKANNDLNGLEEQIQKAKLLFGIKNENNGPNWGENLLN